MFTLSAYIKEASLSPLLSRSEELDLAIKSSGGDIVSRNKLISSNLRLVISNAKYYSKFSSNGHFIEDMVSAGNIGLVIAAQRYDPSRGVRFSSYAVEVIRDKMRECIRDNRLIRIPNTSASLARRAERLGKLQSMRPKAKSTYLSTIAAESALFTRLGFDTQDCKIDTSHLIDSLISSEQLSILRSAVCELFELESSVIRMRFGIDTLHPLTLCQSGCQLHLSKERIRQIQNAALAKLRLALAV